MTTADELQELANLQEDAARLADVTRKLYLRALGGESPGRWFGLVEENLSRVKYSVGRVKDKCDVWLASGGEDGNE